MPKVLWGAVVALLAAPSATADVIAFQFDGTTVNSNIAGTTTSALLTIEMDNGNSGLISQTWTSADLVSAVLTSGTYTLDFALNGSVGFSTDTAGNLVTAAAGGLGGVGSVDNFGTSTSFNAGVISVGSNNNFYRSTTFVENTWTTADRAALGTATDLTNWSIASAPVPEPGTFAGLASLMGLGGASGLRRQRRRR